LAVIATLAVGTPAGATVIGQEHYSGTDSFSFNDCGFWLDGETEFYGQALLRVDPGGEAFLVKDKFWFRTVLTNRDTGEWFVIRGNVLFHEIKATHVTGTIYEFVAIEAGQPFILEDSAGTSSFATAVSSDIPPSSTRSGTGNPAASSLKKRPPLCTARTRDSETTSRSARSRPS